jgi:hypothetical protein
MELKSMVIFLGIHEFNTKVAFSPTFGSFNLKAEHRVGKNAMIFILRKLNILDVITLHEIELDLVQFGEIVEHHTDVTLVKLILVISGLL